MRSPRSFPGSASSELLRHMFGFRCQNRGRVSMSINWPESWYGRLRRATASTVVNTAVLPPIPNARVMAAIAVKPGCAGGTAPRTADRATTPPAFRRVTAPVAPRCALRRRRSRARVRASWRTAPRRGAARRPRKPRPRGLRRRFSPTAGPVPPQFRSPARVGHAGAASGRARTGASQAWLNPVSRLRAFANSRQFRRCWASARRPCAVRR